MAKYAPLYRFLRRRQHDEDLTLTFAEIERIIGGSLPKAAGKAEWWSNIPAAERREVQHDAWLDAGYLALPGPKETVTFRRVTGSAHSSSSRQAGNEAIRQRSAPSAG